MIRTPKIAGFAQILKKQVEHSETIRNVGIVSKLVGLTLESFGPAASVGDIVAIESGLDDRKHYGEVVGFKDDRLLLFPLEGIHGIKNGDKVTLVNEGFTIRVGEELLGRVLDGLGRPIDGKQSLKCKSYWNVKRSAPNSMLRQRIRQPFFTGVRCIDAAITCGKGQRMGIFAGSGVGKSSLLGMICRNALSDLNVIALIGERGKEVREFIEDILGEDGIKKSVLIVSTSDKSPLERVKGAEVAMSIAEYFREQGKDVLFVMDSITRYAMAQREIGLAIGEPPATRGYPPSVFSMMPALLERAGTSDKGSITAFFTVLVEADDMNDPIGDTARSILDGHIVLSRELAHRSHYPAIDVLQSISRVMNNVVSREHLGMAQELRNLIATYRKAEDMINIGAYKNGTNAEIDRAIEKNHLINQFLKQEPDEKYEIKETFERLREILA